MIRRSATVVKPTIAAFVTLCFATLGCIPQPDVWTPPIGGGGGADEPAGGGNDNAGGNDNGGGDVGGGGNGASDDLPDLPGDDESYCEAVVDWVADWSQFESEVIDLLNERRAEGADCGSEGTFGSAGPLTSNDVLQCAARNHSMNMALSGFFDHTDPDGRGAGDRIDLAGYLWSAFGENIAWGQPSPERVVDGWMGSSGHCANIMNPDFTEVGVGYYSGHYWTLSFGRPRN